MLIDESSYQRLADDTFRKLEDLFADVDADDVECERSGDVITLSFKGGARSVINTQRPTRQIWLAASARAWHFSWDEARALWIDDKDHVTELFSHVKKIVHDVSNGSVSLAVSPNVSIA